MAASTGYRTVPPSRFQRTINDPSTNSLTILDASSAGIELGVGAPYATFKGHTGGTRIFAERVTLQGSKTDPKAGLNAQGWDLSISCNDLVVEPNNASAYVTTRGNDGIGSASEGGRGGKLELYVARMSPSKVSQLWFDARGGRGAANGGGKGGPGGKILLAWNIDIADITTALQSFKTTAGLPSKLGQTDDINAPCVSDNDPILVSLRDLIDTSKMSYKTQLKDYPELFDPVEAQFDFKIATGAQPKDEDGYPVRSVYTITLAINDVIGNIRRIHKDSKTPLGRRSLIDGGFGGQESTTGSNRGAVGQEGERGSVTLYPIGVEPTATPQSIPFCYAHPEQCAMTLDRIRTYFYLGSRTNREKAAQLGQALVNRLSFLDDSFVAACSRGDSSIPLVNAYMRLYSNATTLSSEISRLRAVQQAAITYLIQLTATSVDFYGLTADWVPRLNHKTFQTEIDAALDHLGETEDIFLTFLNAADSKEKLDEATQKAERRIGVAQKGVEDDLVKLRDALGAAHLKLKSFEKIQALEKAQREAEEGLKRLHQKISNAPMDLDINLALKHVAKFASSPSKGEAVKSVAKFGYESWTTIPNAKGERVEKSLLIDRLTLSSNNVASLKQGLQEASTKLGDKAPPSDSISEKILVEVETLEAVLSQFAADKFGAEAIAAKDLMRKFAELSMSRNADIVAYNFVVKSISDKEIEMLKLQAEAETITKSRLDGEQNTAKNLAGMKNLLATMYDSQRARVMKLLGLLQRSLRYKLLTEVDHIDQIFADEIKSGPGVDEAALSMTKPVLKAIAKKLSEALFNEQEEQGIDKSLFPSQFDGAGLGKLYRLSPTQLQQLLVEGSTRVTISPVDAVADESHEKSSNFRGCADVRIYRVRFWLYGVRIATSKLAANPPTAEKDAIGRRFETSELITIKLTHTGREKIVSAKNQGFEFVHKPFDVTFSYRVLADGTSNIADAASGDIVNFSSSTREANSIYAAPSPYTDWVVSLQDFDRDSLDLSGLSGGAFEFFGSYRSFNSSL